MRRHKKRLKKGHQERLEALEFRKAIADEKPTVGVWVIPDNDQSRARLLGRVENFQATVVTEGEPQTIRALGAGIVGFNL